MDDRYKVIDGSESAHCCFEATVIDTTIPGDGCDRIVCECFDMESAELICKSLNKEI